MIATAQAAIVGTGDVSPLDPSTWTYDTNGYIGSTSEGMVTVDGGYALVSSNAYLGYQPGSTGTALITGGYSFWSSANNLYVGHSGSGTVRVEAGGVVGVIGDGYLGYNSGSSGMAIITGGGSQWNGNNALYIGYSGDGTLNVEAGGRVFTSGVAYLGYHSGSTGSATITGTNSNWTSSDFYVGYNGSGRLTVTAGGTVTLGKGIFASLDDLAGNGVISTNGAVLDADLVFDAAHGLQQTIAFGSGGALNLNQNSNGALGAGYKGNGTLRIANAVAVSCSSGYLGYQTGSTGTAIVSGAGSKWNCGTLHVGYYGNGSLTVTEGGSVSATQGLFASLSSLLGNGSISANGAVLDADLVFDLAHGLQNTFSFGASGTLVVSPTGSGALGAGYKGNGTLRIAEGKGVMTSDGYLGYHSGSTGTAMVTGAGSQWKTMGDFSVGHSGNGTLTVAAGGQVENANNGYLGCNPGSTGMATVTGAGSKWTITKNFYVGRSGSGMLSVAAGGQISNSDLGCLGYDAGSAGMATITGTGSKWTMPGNLDVGYSGVGVLYIESAGQVSNFMGYLGYNAGSTGTATVTGAGSQWTSKDLYVGYFGSGSLTVTEGGMATANLGIFTSLDSLFGNGAISANGGVLDADLIFDTAHGLQNTFSFGTGGTLTITNDQNTRGHLGAGYKEHGTLRITNGIAAASLGGWLGYHSGSSGTATVNGDGSQWNSAFLYVGKFGDGALNIEAGGQVGCSSDSFLGYESGSTGTARVTGSDSKWTTKGTFNVGYSGDGTLTVEAGGQVNNSGDGYLGYGPDSTGTATVTGAGSTWTCSSNLYIGNSGSGSLTIAAGGQVGNTKYGYLGYNPGSTGTITVTGTGSTWMNSGFLLYVGNSGDGTLTIEDGGQVNSAMSYLGYNSNAAGTATVTGTNSMWTMGNASFYVGYSGQGMLKIEAGGKVCSSASFLGYNSNSLGTAMVTGTNSTWNMGNDSITVGYSGQGTLEVKAGGQVSNGSGGIGYLLGSNGSVLVTGARSKWINNLNLYVGYSGHGTLNIEDGGQVGSTSTCYLGYNSNSLGTVTVAGMSSAWTCTGTLNVGSNGSGTLNVGSGAGSGGLVAANTLNVNTRGICNLNGGTLQSGTINTGSGIANFSWYDGTIRNYDANTNLMIFGNRFIQLASTGTHAFDIDPGQFATVNVILSDLTSGGTLTKRGEGLLTLTGINTFSGQTTVEAGQLTIMGSGSILKTSGIAIDESATLELARAAGSATAANVGLINDGMLLVSAGSQTVGVISGSGVTRVGAGARLTAVSIAQDTLIIGTFGANADAIGQVPEPSAIIFFGLGVTGLAVWIWRRKIA